MKKKFHSFKVFFKYTMLGTAILETFKFLKLTHNIFICTYIEKKNTWILFILFDYIIILFIYLFEQKTCSYNLNFTSPTTVVRIVTKIIVHK